MYGAEKHLETRHTFPLRFYPLILRSPRDYPADL